MGVCSMLNNISWEKDTAALVTVSFLIIHRYLACALNASDINIDIRGVVCGILCCGDSLSFDKVAKSVRELLTFMMALCAAIFSAMNYLSAEYTSQTRVGMFFVLSVVVLSCIIYGFSIVLHGKYGIASGNSLKILVATTIPLIVYICVVLYCVNATTSPAYTLGYVLVSFALGIAGGYVAYARGSKGDSALDTVRKLISNHTIASIAIVTIVFTVFSLSVILNILSVPS